MAEDMQFFDADMQQFLQKGKLNVQELIWIQTARIGRYTIFDSKEGGREEPVLGPGGNPIGNRYVPRPQARYYNLVAHLYDLIWDRLAELGDDEKGQSGITKAEIKTLHESASEEEYQKTRELFRAIRLKLNDLYGGSKPIVDIVTKLEEECEDGKGIENLRRGKPAVLKAKKRDIGLDDKRDGHHVGSEGNTDEAEGSD